MIGTSAKIDNKLHYKLHVKFYNSVIIINRNIYFLYLLFDFIISKFQQFITVFIYRN